MTLDRLRYPVRQLRGRRYPEPVHPYRNEFQRDRDRVVHARAFRRLEDKTQVFAARYSDHFRNRLTHTIEVAQIARTVASALRLDEDFTEALALAHDIGHPPFAHAGESELNQQMERFGERFDHNIHALHIVEQFEQRYARFPGLNLTFEVREGIVKHSRDFAPGEFPDLDEYLPGTKPPVEAQIIDLADEIAYNCADLDDGYSAGMFTLDAIAASIPHYGDLLDEVRAHFPAARDEVHFQEVLRTLIDLLASGLIEGTTETASALGVETLDDVRAASGRVARMTPVAAETNAALKRFLFANVYSSEALIAERNQACEGIARMFEFYLQHPDQLPENHRDRLNELPAHRVVCDYIAGMTDGFFRRTAASLLGRWD